MSDLEIRNIIIEFLLNNEEDIQKTIARVPGLVAYDAVVDLIERETGLNYIDILTVLDENTFRNLYLL